MAKPLVLGLQGRLLNRLAGFGSVWRRWLGRSHRAAERCARLTAYVEKLEKWPLQPNLILYESFNGRGICCNSYAIFKYLLDNPAYPGLTHIWALRDDVSRPDAYGGRSDVIFVPYGSELHYQYLATAGYLVSNNTLLPEVIRRPGQRYLNTCHGTPLKAMGRDMRGPVFLPQGDLPRDLLQATHVTAPNEHTLRVILGTSEIQPFFSGRTSVLGQPRVDLLLNMDEKAKTDLRHRLGLATDKPVLLYAPTFRAPAGAAVDVRVDGKRLKADLRAMAEHWPGTVLFKGHHTTAGLFESRSLPVRVVPFHMEVAEVLALTDLLVTDYSSLFFDFLPTRRPVIFYQYDLDEYEERRGSLYFRPEELPGPVCRNREALVKNLASFRPERPFSAGPVYLDFLARYASHEDGQSSRRAAEFLFRTDPPATESPEDGLTRWLLHLGAWPLDVPAAEFLRLLERTDFVNRQILLALDDCRFWNLGRGENPAKWRSDQVNFLPRRGKRLYTEDERRLLEPVSSGADPSVITESEEIVDVRRRNLEREFRRVFGSARFDLLAYRAEVDSFWGELFQAAAPGYKLCLALPGCDPAAWLDALKGY